LGFVLIEGKCYCKFYILLCIKVRKNETNLLERKWNKSHSKEGFF